MCSLMLPSYHVAACLPCDCPTCLSNSNTAPPPPSPLPFPLCPSRKLLIYNLPALGSFSFKLQRSCAWTKNQTRKQKSLTRYCCAHLHLQLVGGETGMEGLLGPAAYQPSCTFSGSLHLKGLRQRVIQQGSQHPPWTSAHISMHTNMNTCIHMHTFTHTKRIVQGDGLVSEVFVLPAWEPIRISS